MMDTNGITIEEVVEAGAGDNEHDVGQGGRGCRIGGRGGDGKDIFHFEIWKWFLFCFIEEKNILNLEKCFSKVKRPLAPETCRGVVSRGVLLRSVCLGGGLFLILHLF